MKQVANQSESRLERKKNRLAFLVLTAITALPFMLESLFYSGQVLGNPDQDNPLFFYFANAFSAQSWLQGEVPHWNPYVMCGYPFLAEGQSGVFYPLSVLFVLFGTGLAINLFIASHVILGGWFYYGYLRFFGVQRFAGVTVACVLCYSSLFLSRIHCGQLNVLSSLTWGIAILFCWEAFYKTKNWLYLAAFSACYACLILTYYPPSILMFSLFILVYVASGVLFDLKASTERAVLLKKKVREVSLLGFFTLLGVGIGMISLSPGAAFAANSFRGAITYEFAGTFSFPPENLLSLLCPWFFGETTDRVLNPMLPSPYFGRQYLWEAWIYIGILPLLASVTGFLRCAKIDKFRVASCLLLSFLVMSGKHTPVHRFLFDHFPFFNYFRGSGKYSVLVLLCLTTFAAVGIDHWSRGRESARSVRFIEFGVPVVVLSILAFLGVYFGLNPSSPDGRWSTFIEWIYSQNEIQLRPFDPNGPEFLHRTWINAGDNLWKAGIFAGLVLVIHFVRSLPSAVKILPVLIAVVVFLDLSPYFHRYLDKYPESFVTTLEENLPPELRSSQGLPVRVLDQGRFNNKAMTQRYSSIEGYTGNQLKRYNTFLHRSQGRSAEEARQSLTRARVDRIAEEFRFLSLDYVLVDSRYPANIYKPPVFLNELYALIAFEPQRPRLFLAESPETVETPEAALDALWEGGKNRTLFPLVEGHIEQVSRLPLGPEDTLSVTDYSNNSVSVSVKTESPRLLVLTEVNAPGWTATVNDKDSPIYYANYLFRSVVVPAGTSTVRFSFTSPGFDTGLKVTIVSLGIWLMLLGYGLWRRHQGV
jgi:membrane protein YfhO